MLRKAVGAIVFCRNKYLIIQKSKINTFQGKIDSKQEWDFIKGGVERSDKTVENAILRELEEETGSKDYFIHKKFEEKILFDFPPTISRKIGYEKQEITMFLVEYIGKSLTLNPMDDEIRHYMFLNEDDLLEKLTHKETKDYFSKHMIKAH